METGGKGKPVGGKGKGGIIGGEGAETLVGEGGNCFMFTKSALVSNFGLIGEEGDFLLSS